MPATGSSRTPGSSGRLSTGLSRTAKDRDEAVVRYRVEPAETVDRVRGVWDGSVAHPLGGTVRRVVVG
jgi:hypothetical protein